MSVIVIGLGATLFMDIWALLLKRAFGIAPANYCLVGRWFCHMPRGTFVHASIANSSKRPFECAVGWISHYAIGALYAVAFAAFVSSSWLSRPTLLPALLFGVSTVLVPFLVMHPSFGLGVAASKSTNPAQARLKSLTAHIAFGVGLYLCAVGLSDALPGDAQRSSATPLPGSRSWPANGREWPLRRLTSSRVSFMRAETITYRLRAP